MRGNLIYSRVFRHYGSTILGCLVILLTKVGEELRKYERTIYHGNVLCSLSTIVAGIGLCMAKFKEIPPESVTLHIPDNRDSGNFVFQEEKEDDVSTY